MCYPNVEVFLSQIEHEIFKKVQSLLGYWNLSREEWKAVCSLANDRNIVTNKADKRVLCCDLGSKQLYNGSRRTT